ncbi:NAD(P)H-dependent oxidoreductase [uncultured Acetobacterium sp.]|uniref:NAD(P)H-dependent oxidoreductase n=1 Tax=uncultured Acetobacterium sp. TaxID=217139 RepID=UPI0025F7C69A|nr:NAD(P)H-dependent oxidoreductase [uncultured Acetobacterium sp.]
MNLLICNGSPRGEKSNSTTIAKWFSTDQDKMILLMKASKHQAYLDTIASYGHMVFIYPLYVDAMPGIVKAFFERLATREGLMTGKKVSFIIHSGFPESVHLEVLTRYHQILARKLGFVLVDTIVIPGSEGFRLMPPQQNRKKQQAVMALMEQFRSDQPFDKHLLKRLAGKRQGTKTGNMVFSLLAKTGITNLYWDSNLKRNQAYEKRFDQPYAEK